MGKFKVGDMVQVNAGAVYLNNNKEVPATLLNTKLFVREVNAYSCVIARARTGAVLGEVDNENLRYRELNHFDKAMIDLLKNEKVLSLKTKCRWLHNDDKIIMYTKGDLAFAFNFHPEKSFDGYFVPVEKVIIVSGVSSINNISSLFIVRSFPFNLVTSIIFYTSHICDICNPIIPYYSTSFSN